MSRKSGWIKALFALVLGGALGFAGGRFWFASQAGQQLDLVQIRSQAALAQSRSDLAAARAALDSAQGQLTIEQSTRKGLEGTLQNTQAELGRAHDRLAFYEQLLPPGPNGAVSLRAFDLERHGPALQYRVLLMRNAPDDPPFSGSLQFMAKGVKTGKTVQLELQPVQAATDPPANGTGVPMNALALSFDQFQRSAGLLSIPAGFVPDSVTLNVLEGGTVRVSRTVKAPR